MNLILQRRMTEGVLGDTYHVIAHYDATDIEKRRIRHNYFSRPALQSERMGEHAIDDIYTCFFSLSPLPNAGLFERFLFWSARTKYDLVLSTEILFKGCTVSVSSNLAADNAENAIHNNFIYLSERLASLTDTRRDVVLEYDRKTGTTRHVRR